MNKKIYDTIRDRILFLEYEPGRILNEKELAKEFGVSRTPMREVLSRLEWEKLTRVLPRTGTMVTEIEFTRMMNVYQVRFEMEELGWRLAAENITKQDLDQLRELGRQCKDLENTEDRRDLVKIDIAYRDIVYRAANNRTLEQISRQLYDQTLRLWFSVFIRGDWSEEVEAVKSEIEECYKVLAQKDGPAAGRFRKTCMSGHMERIKDKF